MTCKSMDGGEQKKVGKKTAENLRLLQNTVRTDRKLQVQQLYLDLGSSIFQQGEVLRKQNTS